MTSIEGQLLAARTDFGWRLLERLVETADANVFISPTSIALALTLIYTGAQGATRSAMARTLGITGLDVDEVNRAYQTLVHSLVDSGPQRETRLATSLWVAAGLTLHPDFAARALQSYDAFTQAINFTARDAASIVNQWASDQTNGRIADLLTPCDVNASTLMALLNALYFKGRWRVPFDPADTTPRPFTRLDGVQRLCPMMTQTGSFRYVYVWEQGLQGIYLPYGDGRVGMMVFLPVEVVPPLELHRRLMTRPWTEWLAAFDEETGTVTLPRFTAAYEVSLTAVLTHLGMGIAFGSQADFGGIVDGPAYLSEVRHKTFVEVNEEGAEAAAATAVMMDRSLPFEMRVDHPFCCAIVDSHTGEPLFMGYINDPA
ncbi:MAG: serpin family protein [Anaerolineae bacterium]|nr:serpin family protein [Anaerolineae bacterium]